MDTTTTKVLPQEYAKAHAKVHTEVPSRARA
jgi:hypothetical protein